METEQTQEKIKLWEEDKFVYPILDSYIYMNEEKTLIYFVRLPTDKESEGFFNYSEPDWLELQVGEDESSLYVITNTYSIKEFNKIIDNFKNLTL
jgi:hypothetical protein